MRKLEVTWRDSVSSVGKTWFNLEDAKEWGKDDLTFTTVGYFVMEDKHNLVLATSRMNRPTNDKVGGLWSIPKGCIIKRRKL
jgi:hypothetical protein